VGEVRVETGLSNTYTSPLGAAYVWEWVALGGTFGAGRFSLNS
jgi:hypothetical protein